MSQKIINQHNKDIASLKSMFIWTAANFGVEYAQKLNWYGLDTADELARMK